MFKVDLHLSGITKITSNKCVFVYENIYLSWLENKSDNERILFHLTISQIFTDKNMEKTGFVISVLFLTDVHITPDLYSNTRKRWL